MSLTRGDQRCSVVSTLNEYFVRGLQFHEWSYDRRTKVDGDTVVDPILCRVVSLEKNRHKIEMA